MNRTFRRFFVLAGVATLSGACAENAPTTPAGSDSYAAEQQVARAIALAMSDPEVRVAVRQAMGASPYVEHKLVLQDFIQTVEASPLVAGAARYLGTDINGFRGAVKILPRLDFYAPRPADRMTWSGTANITVGATLEEDATPPFVFQPDGKAVAFDISDRASALFVLAPAEAKDRRIDPFVTHKQSVIQSAADGEIGGSIMRYDSQGILLEEIQLADLPHRVMGGAKMSAASAVGPIDTTFLGQFSTDAGDGIFVGLEIEFRAKYYDGSGQLRESRTVRNTGVRAHQLYYWNEPLIFRRIADTSYQYIRLNIVETDAFVDDDMGNKNFYWGDNDRVFTISGSDDNSNVSLFWVPKWISSAYSSTVEIQGASNIPANTSCTWNMSTSVTNPQIEWRVGELVIGNGEQVTHAAGSDFLLEVQVWNTSTGEGANSAKQIYVASGNTCNLQ